MSAVLSQRHEHLALMYKRVAGRFDKAVAFPEELKVRNMQASVTRHAVYSRLQDDKNRDFNIFKSSPNSRFQAETVQRFKKFKHEES